VTAVNARRSPDQLALAALAPLALSALAGAGGGDLGGLKDRVRELARRDPLDSVLVTVLGGSYLFWLAEREVNPKARTFLDALVFISTCMSVGYSDIFAKTPSGKAIASAVMTIGPSLTASLFAPRTDTKPAPDPHLTELVALQRQVLARLDTLVEASRAPAP
jgi:hypothetical protein